MQHAAYQSEHNNTIQDHYIWRQKSPRVWKNCLAPSSVQIQPTDCSANKRVFESLASTWWKSVRPVLQKRVDPRMLWMLFVVLVQDGLQGAFSLSVILQIKKVRPSWLVACVWRCCLIGGDAGEEVWGPVCVPAGSEDDPDGVQAVPHEQEFREASQLGLREQDDPAHHPVQHEDAGTKNLQKYKRVPAQKHHVHSLNFIYLFFGGSSTHLMSVSHRVRGQEFSRGQKMQETWTTPSLSR